MCVGGGGGGLKGEAGVGEFFAMTPNLKYFYFCFCFFFWRGGGGGGGS